MARWLAFLLLAGGACAILSVLTLPLPRGTHPGGLASVGTVALITGGVVWLLRERLSPVGVSLLLPMVTVFVGFAVLFDGASSGTTPMFYVWVVLYAAYFLSLWQTTLQVAGIGVTQALVLSTHGPDGTELTRWFVTMIVLGVAGAVIAHLVGRLRHSLAAHADALDETQELTRRLAEVANTDELTRVANRRGWEREFEREMARARRGGTSLCVAILDLDHFKEFNDSYGHLAGDRVLRDCAEAWSAQLRVGDLLARYGGEEFAVLLPACDPEAAAALVERLRAATPPGQTVSAGVASWSGSEEMLELMKRADAALYQAKSRGRDRTVLALEAPAPEAVG